MDVSLRDRHAPPAWLYEKFDWGPSTWPVYWCEAAEAESIDCGVFAAIARALLLARDVPAAAVQLVEKFNEKNVENWRARWMSASAGVDWLEPPFCYHEAVGLIDGNTLTIWDPLDQKRVTPHVTGGYGKVVFLRIFEPVEEKRDTVQWEHTEVEVGRWIDCTDM